MSQDDRSTTPPEGVDFSAPDNPAHVLLLLNAELQETRKAIIRLSSRLESTDGVQRGHDALIRRVEEQVTQFGIAAAQASRHAHLAEKSSERNEEQIRGLQIDLADYASATIRELAAIRADIGQAPIVFDPRASRPGEHTPEQLTQMERGTGLRGEVAALAASHSRLTKQVFAAGGGGITFGTVLVKVMDIVEREAGSSLGVWVAILVLLVVGFGGVFLMRGARKGV